MPKSEYPILGVEIVITQGTLSIYRESSYKEMEQVNTFSNYFSFISVEVKQTNFEEQSLFYSICLKLLVKLM